MSDAAVRLRRGGRPLRPRAGSSGPDIRFALGLDGLSLWLFVLTSLLMITAIFASWESITERAAAALRVPAGARDGAARALRQPRRGALLHLLRVHADPALLPDRDLGRPAAAAGVGHVLPLHAGRQPADALGVIALVVVHYQYSPGHVLTFSIPELTRGPGAPCRLGRVARRPTRWTQPAGPDLPAAVRGVRDQGADVPVPHLAAAGPRRGARRPARSCWPACCSRSAATACSGSTWG